MVSQQGLFAPFPPANRGVGAASRPDDSYLLIPPKRAPVTGIVSGSADREKCWRVGSPSDMLRIDGNFGRSRGSIMSSLPITTQIKDCLHRWAQGEQAARDELLAIVSEWMRRLVAV